MGDEEVVERIAAPAIFTWIYRSDKVSWKSYWAKPGMKRWSCSLCLPGLGNHHVPCHCQWTGRQSQADFRPVIEKGWWLGSYPHDLEPGILSLSMRSIVLCQLKKAYSAMEDFYIDNKDYAMRAAGVSIWTFLLSLWLGRNDAGMLSNPLRVRLDYRTHGIMSKRWFDRDCAGPLRSLRWKLTTRLVVVDSPWLPTGLLNGCAICSDYGRWLDWRYHYRQGPLC